MRRRTIGIVTAVFVIVVAIILVGMIIGSAVAMNAVVAAASLEQYSDLFFRIAYLGYIIAMTLAAVIGIRLVWRWLRRKNVDED